MDHIVARLLPIVGRIAGPTRTPADAGADTRLWGGGFWLDSIELMHLMLACDDEFGPPAGPPPAPDALATVGALAASLAGRRR
jgi:hypothetical protein